MDSVTLIAVAGIVEILVGIDRDDIYRATEPVPSEFRRHYSLVYLYPVDELERDVVYRKIAVRGVQGVAVHINLHPVAFKSAHIYLGLASGPSCLTEFHPRLMVEYFAQ